MVTPTQLASEPCSVSYLLDDDEAIPALLGLNEYWPTLADGPLKTLLSGIYLKDGQTDTGGFLEAAGRAGLKVNGFAAGGPDEPPRIDITLQYSNFFLSDPERYPDQPVVGPKGSVGLSLNSPSRYFMMNIQVSHSIIK